VPTGERQNRLNEKDLAVEGRQIHDASTLLTSEGNADYRVSGWFEGRGGTATLYLAVDATVAGKSRTAAC
jgi:hypothetical protein